MIKIAVFASGRGSNCQAIQEQIEIGEISAQISLVVTNRETAGVIEYASRKMIPLVVIKPEDFESALAFGNHLIGMLGRASIDWIVLAGYLKKIPSNVVEKYSNRIVNIHPSLLPAFGGKGMYGMRVHRAVFESGARLSGVTVHLVNNEYDAGPVVAQRAADISQCRQPEDIAKIVLAVEHRLFPEALKKLFKHPYHIESNRVVFEGYPDD